MYYSTYDIYHNDNTVKTYFEHWSVTSRFFYNIQTNKPTRQQTDTIANREYVLHAYNVLCITTKILNYEHYFKSSDMAEALPFRNQTFVLRFSKNILYFRKLYLLRLV